MDIKQPKEAIRKLLAVIDDVKPDVVLVDHVPRVFALAIHAISNVPVASLATAHASMLAGGDQYVYLHRLTELPCLGIQPGDVQPVVDTYKAWIAKRTAEYDVLGKELVEDFQPRPPTFHYAVSKQLTLVNFTAALDVKCEMPEGSQLAGPIVRQVC